MALVISPNADKTKAILEAPVPENVNQMRAYLGLVNYYNKFLPNLSGELKSLYDLLRKGTKYVWSEQCQKAFERTKSLIVEKKLLWKRMIQKSQSFLQRMLVHMV